jgi:beta-lactamase regulating signal transducer with metallopeptidase domain
MNWLSLQTVAQISVERILNALPEGFLVAIFAWVLLRLLRRQNSGTRFAVWFLALVTIAILPVLDVFGAGQASMLEPMRSIASRAGSMHPAITIPESWAVFVFLVWALGVCVALVRLFAGLWQLRQLRQSCTAIAASDLDPLVRTTVDSISASRSVTVATSDSVRVPAAIGFWKRTIILPAWTLRELPPSDLNVILLHEFAHLRRADEWTNLFQKIVRAIFFFNPAVWWIESQLSVEREMACDDAVLAETANPHGYATCLVSLLEKSLAHRGLSLAQAAVHRAREASLRLAKILDKNRPAATRVWKPALGMIGAFSVICLVAVSHAPQLVAVDRGFDPSVTTASSRSFAPPPLQKSQPAAAVTPVALTTGPLLHSRTGAKSGLPASAPKVAPVQSAQTFEAVPDHAAMINANLNQEMMSQFQTLVFVEATQFGNTPLWRVQVWRVTVLTGVQERTARVPVASSI